MTVRVRFAPSPTGQVHIGNIRAAIFNWLFARHDGGKFLLRIEDTDRERSTPEAVRAVLEAMDWLGLDYDEEPLYQSTRREAHLEAAEELLKKQLAYREDKGGTGKGECVIFRMPDEDVTFHDEIKGQLRKEAGDIKDFVIIRSDGMPVFHLCNVVDDTKMEITHVIRGDDHIENTYRHVALYRALDAEIPKFAHLPMIVNQHGKPYSKRDGDAYIGDFRAKGFHPDALFNYLTLLGWSPGDDREKLSREETITLFSLDRVKSGPAQMDIKKLTHLNAEYVAEMPLDDFIMQVNSVLADKSWARDVDPAYFRAVAELMQSRTHLYTYAEAWTYFFSDDFEYDERAVQKGLKKEGMREALTHLVARLEDTDFVKDRIESTIHDVENAAGIKQGKLNFPVRVAVTGSSTGAGIYETMILLGKGRVIGRLKQAVEKL